MGSGTGGDKGFVAVVSVKIDEASLASAGRAIQDALKKATEGIDLKAFRDIAEAAKLLAAQTDNMAKAEAARSTAKREGLAIAKAELDAAERELSHVQSLARLDRERQSGLNAMAQAQQELNALLQQQPAINEKIRYQLEAEAEYERENLNLVTKTIDEKKRLAAINKAEEDAAKKQALAEKEIAALTDKQLSSQSLIIQTENARAAAYARLTEELAEQNTLIDKQAATAEKIKNAIPFAQGGVNPAFNLGAVGGALGQNFLSSFFSGGGLSSSLSQSLGQLQPALFGIAQGGEQATQAFAKLGIEGVGSVSALTQGVAAFGASFLAVLPLIGEMGKSLKGAYDQQVEFVFQSGLLAKQLGTSAEEGAKLRALLKLVGQEDNIFAAITLNQIQASVAALDRYNKGLEKATPQVEKFGQALTQLGVSYKNQDGSLKTFAELVVDISAGLEKLSASQRSLAVQNLAGLFGGDVAKIFGMGPEGLTSALENAVVVSEDLQKANDGLQISLTNLENAQTRFNIALTAGFVPFQNWLALFSTDVVNNFTYALYNAQSAVSGLFGATEIGANDRGYLETRKAQLESILKLGPGDEAFYSKSQLDEYKKDLAEVNRLLEELNKTQAAADAADAAASPAKILEDKKAAYAAVEKALKAVDKASKDYENTQKAIVKNNEDIAKSFKTEIDSMQKAADTYDKFFEKAGEIESRIDQRQAKIGKKVSWIGDGSKITQDLELAIVNVRVMEERLSKMDVGEYPARADKLRLQISRARAALGLTAGEETIAANVDVKFGYSRLSSTDKKKMEEDIDALVKLRQEFLAGGFDLAQNAFNQVLLGLTANSPEFIKYMTEGSEVLQNFAESVGLFNSPGFVQATAEAGLLQKYLKGGFGDPKDAKSLEAYSEAIRNMRLELIDFAKYIADPKLLKIDTIFQDLDNYLNGPKWKNYKLPVAIELGLVTEADVKFAVDTTVKENLKWALLEGGIGADDPLGVFGNAGNTGLGGADAQRTALTAQQLAAAQEARRRQIEDLGKEGGLARFLLRRALGTDIGEAITATAQFQIDAKYDTSLAEQAGIDATKLLQKRIEAQKLIWKLSPTIVIDPNWDTSILREELDALKNGTYIPPEEPIYDKGKVPGGGRAAGGPVFRGMPTLVGEEGKPEFFIPRSDGRIIPGNETASLMRLMAGNERMPAQPIINYSPVVQQYLTVDARGTNARDVTAAITRTQAKQTLFTSSSALVRDRDFLRAHGIR